MTIERTPTREELTCLHCGKPGVAFDHVQERSTSPHLKKNPKNIAPLCPACHDLKTLKRVATRVAGDDKSDTLLYQWRSKDSDYWVSVPVVVDKRHGCLVKSSEESAAAEDAGNRDTRQYNASASAPSSLTHDQRINIAASIRADQQQRQWVAGDTANAWVAEMGEEAWQYLDDFGYTHMSLSNIMHVCEAIPPSLRHGNLPYSFHVVVYRLNKEEIEMWLDEANEKEWTVREFRVQVHGEPPRAKKRWTVQELQEELRRFEIEMSSEKSPAEVFLYWLAKEVQDG